MARGATRGIAGEGYIADTPGGPVYRVPLPRAPGQGRASYRERRVPAHIANAKRVTIEAWKRDTRATILAAWEAAQAPPTPAAEMVGQYLTRWLAEQPGHLAPNTVAGRRSIITRHLIPQFGDVALVELTPRRIEAGLRAIALAPSSVREIRAVLVAALNDAVRLEVIDRNPAALARGPRRVPIERPRLDAEQVRRLVQAAANERLGTVLVLAGALGLRRGELLGLRWRDVDLEAAMLRVAVQRQREPGRGMVERPPKAGSGRLIALPEPVVESLRAHRDRQRWERQQSGWEDHGLVFTRRDGRPATNDMLGTLRVRVLARANTGRPSAEQLPALRLHDLRGSAATILLALGVPVPAVMRILGHRRAATTLEQYAAALPADLTEAARRMGDALSMGPRLGGGPRG